MPSPCWSPTLIRCTGSCLFVEMPDHNRTLFPTLSFLFFHSSLFLSIFTFLYFNLMLGLSSFLRYLSSTPRIICYDYLAAAQQLADTHWCLELPWWMHVLFKSDKYVSALLVGVYKVYENLGIVDQLVPALNSNIDFIDLLCY